jgi:hypothetical protein
MISTGELPKHGRRWGRWILHDGCLCLPDGQVAYEISVRDLLDTPLWWAAHMADKAWVTEQDVTDLWSAVASLREVA